MRIDKFCPDYFEGECRIDYDYLEDMFGHHLNYASKGRHSIRHIINASGRHGTLVMPVYACSSIPDAVKKTGNDVVFCDIDERDLNLSVQAFSHIVNNQEVTFLLVPSLYGNPADLHVLEQICRERNIYMIDDAAQAFGATLENKSVGSYGNAGFFSFSPGKQLTGSMGSFFWTDNNNYKVNYEYGHLLLHKVAFVDFYYNRYKIYERGKYSPCKLFTYLNIALQKEIDIVNDGLENFEANMIGSLIEEYKKGTLVYKQTIFNEFEKCFGSNQIFRIVRNVRGKPNNQKIVLLFETAGFAQKFRTFMSSRNIYTSDGYKLLDRECLYLTAQNIKGRIVEMPIERNPYRMSFLFDKVREFLAD